MDIALALRNSDNKENAWNPSYDRSEDAKNRIDFNRFFERLSYQCLFNDIAEENQQQLCNETWSEMSTETSLSSDSSLPSPKQTPFLKSQHSDNSFDAIGVLGSIGNKENRTFGGSSQPLANITNMQGLNFNRSTSMNLVNKISASNSIVQQKCTAVKQPKRVRIAQVLDVMLSQPLTTRFVESIQPMQTSVKGPFQFHADLTSIGRTATVSY